MSYTLSFFVLHTDTGHSVFQTHPNPYNQFFIISNTQPPCLLLRILQVLRVLRVLHVLQVLLDIVCRQWVIL